jgi:ribokinase
MPVDTLEDVQRAARVLLGAGVENVIVTLGARGAFWIAASQEKLIPAVEVAAVDTTGAGDAFIGCFSHYLVASGDVERALRLASHYAADSVTKLGTQTSLATKAEFEAAFPQLF